MGNRKGLSIFNFVLIFIGFVCGCVAAAGAFRSEDIIHALPWMTYTLANYTLSGYVDVNGTKVPEYVANRPTNPETYYANLWGCTDDGKNAKLQWKDYPAVNDVCSDSYVPMLWGVGAYAYMILIILANWPNFIIHLIIPVYDEDLHGSQEENKPLSSDVENPEPPPAKKSSGKTRSPGTKSSSGTKKKKTPGGKTGKSSGALSGSQSKAPNGSGTGTEVPAPPPH